MLVPSGKMEPKRLQNQPLRILLLIATTSFFLDSLSTVDSDLASDRAALVELSSAVGGITLEWNVSSSNPCSWVGVTCNGGSVMDLRLPGKGLSGQLPAALGNLTQLQNLSLRVNSLSGTIPPELANLRSLRNLYLQGNFFSGDIPASLFSLQDLLRLSLANNNFSGSIPSGFNNLKKLKALNLENNQLTGSIPELDLPALEQVNVSFNHLNGSIPQWLSNKPAAAFEGNSLCGKPLALCNGTSSGSGNNNLSGGAVAGIVIGCVTGFLLILMILLFLCQRKTSEKEKSRSIEGGNRSYEASTSRESGVSGNVDAGRAGAGAGAGAGAKSRSGGKKDLVFFGSTARVFDLEDLLRASAEVLGKGTFGTTYKATLDMGMVMAVKRLKDVTVREKEFREKIEAVGKINHPNLVPLRAYFYSADEKLLVYDYMPMGSLSALLHGNREVGRTPLNWETRSVIALGAARGIAYLHSQSSASSHGNIKSSNILLTSSFEARVSDFGLAHLAGPTPTPNRIDGYRAPEVTDARKISQKADVYSFGVLLLELLTGKAPTHSNLNDEGVDLPRWVQSVVKEEWNSEVFDLELLRYGNVDEEMIQLLQLAVDCTAQYPDNRPSMAEVTARIEELSRSSSQDHNTSHETVDDKSSQYRQTFSVDSGAPHSS